MSRSSQEKIRRRNDPRDRSTLRKAERTRQAILRAAQEFLWEHPFRDLTVAQLMSLAGSSRPVFYQYFADLHVLMEELLNELKQEVLEVARPWLSASDDRPSQLVEGLSGLVEILHQRGPIIRAVVEAAPMDERLEQAWHGFVQVFDDVIADRIEQDQALGLVRPFEARPIAIALNRMNIGVVIHHFGRRPRSRPGPVRDSITRIWVSTIYGQDVLDRV